MAPSKKLEAFPSNWLQLSKVQKFIDGYCGMIDAEKSVYDVKTQEDVVPQGAVVP